MNKLTCIQLDRPAANFTEGFPIGTGRLAAMVFGTVPEDRLSLNHEWLWTARFRGQKTPDRSAQFLPKLRRLIREEKFEEAYRFGNDHFSPRGGVSGIPERIDSYQCAGSFCIAAAEGAGTYERELEFRTGVAVSRHGIETGAIERECFADLTDDVIRYRLRSRDGVPFSGCCRLNRVHETGDELECTAADNLLTMSGKVSGGVRFMTLAKLFVKGGTCKVSGDQLIFDHAVEVTAILDVEVNRDGEKKFPRKLERLEYRDWDAALKEHVKLWQSHYDRCKIEVPGGGDALRFYNFGRYLLLASAIRAELPPNIQGKWNEDCNPPWSCDYHLNINFQMNHWGAEATGLGWVNERLFDYIDRLAESGREVARETWGVKGIFLPHAADVWARATPEAYGWSVWLGCAPWLAQHYMQHYRYTRNREFLAKRAWPFVRDSACFFENLLQYDENGVLEILPSQSPENQFKGGGCPVSLCKSAAGDIELLDELLRDAIQVSELLGVEREHRAVWRRMRERMPKLQIGADGRLLEWDSPERVETEPGHRHLSHLIGMFPGSVITRTETPELFVAAKKSLAFRRRHFKGFMPGWSRAWLANIFVLIGDGDLALQEIETLADNQSSISLLDLHPPKIFQIDGNFGILSAVAAMLLRMEAGVLYLLPAIPSKWADGEANGLCAENTLTVSLKWRKGRLILAKVRTECGGKIRIALPAGITSDHPGRKIGNAVEFNLNPGEVVMLG